MIQKKISPFIYILTLFAISSSAWSQTNEIITYYDKKGKKVNAPDSAYFIRTIVKIQDNELYSLTERYKDGSLKTQVKTKNISGLQSSYIDTLTTYHPNGKLESKQFYNNGKIQGKTSWYYDNGQLQKEIIEGNYLYALDNGVFTPDTLLTYFTEEGEQKIKDGNGFLKEIKEEDFEEGNYKNGLRTGEWKGTFSQDKYEFIETYNEGNIVSGISSDKKGKQYPYTTLGQAPKYPNGGVNKLRNQVASNYSFPRLAILANVSGTVYIDFVIDKDGKMVDIKVREDIGYGTGTAAKDALRKVSQRWTPGYQRGIPVRVQYSLPIRLALR